MEYTLYRLPDGRIVSVDATAAKNLPTIQFEVAPDATGRRRFVLAYRVNRFEDGGSK